MIMRNSALNQSISIIIPVHNGDKTIQILAISPAQDATEIKRNLKSVLLRGEVPSIGLLVRLGLALLQ